MNKIDPELARILVKRIRKALEHARYFPAKSADTEGIAMEIVRPYLERVDQPIGSLPSYHVCPPGTEELARKAYRAAFPKKDTEAADAIVALERENTILRGLLPKLGAPCVYCGQVDIGKCPRGFPGCAQADDLMCADDETFKSLVAKVNVAESALAEAHLALNATADEGGEIVAALEAKLAEARERIAVLE